MRLEVVNCFQNLLPSWQVTTFCNVAIFERPLWIAFKIYYLRDRSQPLLCFWKAESSCELLSKFITFVTGHNKIEDWNMKTVVVNCFQNLLPSWQVTTEVVKDLLDDSCELLSKFITFVTGHNFQAQSLRFHFVVNCFQNLLPSWQVTTRGCRVRRW